MLTVFWDIVGVHAVGVYLLFSPPFKFGFIFEKGVRSKDVWNDAYKKNI